MSHVIKHHMATANLTCQQCSRAFSLHTSPANIKRTKFCGRACAAVSFSKIPPLLESLKSRLDIRRVVHSDGCIIYTGQNNGTYGQLEYRRKTYLAHRAAYMVYKGAIPEGMCVCHSCDTPLCINPAHLWLGSYQDNVRDMHNKGRARFNPLKKLTDEKFLEFRKAIDDGVKQRVIASQFGVSQSYVSMVKNAHRRSSA